MIMDRACEGNETRQLVLDLGMTPLVPRKANRVIKWDYDRPLYKRRNKVQRLSRRLKGDRRIFSRVEKLDVMYRAFLNCALIMNMIKCEHDLISGSVFQNRSLNGRVAVCGVGCFVANGLKRICRVTVKDNRLFLETVFWRVHTGAPWRDLLPAFGYWNNPFQRFRNPI